MDFAFSDDELAFAAELRAWVERELPPDWQQRFHVGSPEFVEFLKGWERSLYQGGWAGIHWPKEHGGMGASAAQKVLYTMVMAETGAPEGIGSVLGKLGKRLLAPILMEFGDDWQKQRFLPPILRGEEFWCQGFSEPEAGSDLVALTTSAVPDGDDFVVNGQKVWTSQALNCDWCFVLVRTDPTARRHEGISMLLISLDSPGVTRRPIRQINGHQEFCEVFYDDVRVPRAHLVGELNKGWDVAKYLLEVERGVESALARYVDGRDGFARTVREVAAMSPTAQATRAAALGHTQAEIMAIELNALRLLSTQMGGGKPSAWGSIVKLQSTEAWSHATVTEMGLVGEDALFATPSSSGAEALADTSRFLDSYFLSRSATIAAGSSEIQRNIIAKRVLGLSGR